MGRQKKVTKPVTFNMDLGVLDILVQDSGMYGISKGAYISQLIMQKHLELVATGLIEKLTPEQIQTTISEMKGSAV